MASLTLSVSSPSLSPSRSPLLSPNIAPRRLSARRGSVAAADPWGTHSDVNHNPDRTSSSTLTIVRVTSPTVALEDPPVPGSPHQRRVHRRHGSNNSLASTKGDGRVSFASASFGGPNPGPGSPTNSRPHSPVRSLHHHSGSVSRSKLSPEDLVDLARQSASPQYIPSPRPSPGLPSVSPEKGVAAAVAPASFTQLADDVYLPFIHRASEVATLLSTHPTCKLLALLQQTFPATQRDVPPSPILTSNASDKSSERSVPPSSPVDVSGDPAQWSFAQLAYWLKYVDRDVASDEVWVRKARRCITSHSELIWERLKGALGVPPDLDVDADEQRELDEMYKSGDDMSPIVELPAAFTQRHSSNVGDGDIGALGEMEPEVSPERFESEISIEPVMVPNSPSLTSTDSASGLHDIREAEEDDVSSPVIDVEEPVEACQGLRICTSPSFNNIGNVSRSPFSFASPNLAASDDHGRSSSKMSLTRRASFGSMGSANDMPFDVLRERGPGHPLFPSNFANLALGPTLSANNPSLRRPSAPPPPAYANPHSIRSGVRGRRVLPSWADGYDAGKYEHALTIDSSSSIGE